MTNKTLSAVLIFSLALNLAVVGIFIFKKVNQPHFMGPPREFQRGLSTFFNEMDLNEKQREVMFSHLSSFREKSQTGEREIIKLEHELFTYIRSEDAQKEKILKLVGKIGELKTAQAEAVIDHFLEFKSVLNVEQQDHFFNMLMEKRPGRHRMGPPNGRPEKPFRDNKFNR